MQSKLNRRIYRYTLALLLISSPLLVHADLLNRNFTVTYEATFNGIYLGDTVRTFKQLPDGKWQYTGTTIAKGLASVFFKDIVKETSTLIQKGKTIMPLTYRYDQTGGKDEEHYQIDFLWDKQKIHTSYENKDFNLEKNPHDLMTFQLQIMRDLQNHQNTMTYFIASRGKASSYVLTQNGSKKIETPLKEMETIELVSNKLNDNDQYRIWCAVSLEFLPVRIQKIEADGDKIEFQIKEFHLD